MLSLHLLNSFSVSNMPTTERRDVLYIHSQLYIHLANVPIHKSPFCSVFVQLCIIDLQPAIKQRIASKPYYLRSTRCPMSLCVNPPTYRFR